MEVPVPIDSPAFWIAAASAGFVFYVLFAYPALLAFRTRNLPEPSAGPSWEPRVTVLLPVHNGERWLEAKLRSLVGLDYPGEKLEILVVADGCSDRTVEVAEAFAGQGVRAIAVPPGGKAMALNRGMEEAAGEVYFFTDVRQRIAPDALRRMLSKLSVPEVGVVSGELVILDGETQQEASTGLYWKYEKWIRTRLSRLDSVPGATGCIYLMKRELANPLPAGTLLDDMYLPLGAFFAGYRVLIEPGAHAFDLPTGLETEFRRKVRTLAGNYQILTQYPALLGPGNRMWIHYVSHKLGRLLLPHALLALAISTVFLPDPLRIAVAAPQALIYSLAALDTVLPRGSGAARLTAPARTFVVMMAAAFGALSYFVVPSGSLWKPTR